MTAEHALLLGCYRDNRLLAYSGRSCFLLFGGFPFLLAVCRCWARDANDTARQRTTGIVHIGFQWRLFIAEAPMVTALMDHAEERCVRPTVLVGENL